MKKLFQRLLVLLLILLTVGCANSFNDVHMVAVLGKADTDEAVIVLTDVAGNEKSVKIAYPAEEYFGEDAVYYSADKRNYESISYKTLKSGDKLRDIDGIIVYHQANGCTYVYRDNSINVYRNDTRIRELSYQDIRMFKVEKGYLYCTDRNNILSVYDVRDDSLVKQLDASGIDPVNVTTIDGKTYLVSKKGYTLFDNMEIQSTYVYPMEFDEIEGCRGRYISVVKDYELFAYEVSFDEYRMIFSDDIDEEIIGYVDFEKLYSDWYQKGYEVINFYGYVGG